jgi:hypothetical protein
MVGTSKFVEDPDGTRRRMDGMTGTLDREIGTEGTEITELEDSRWLGAS